MLIEKAIEQFLAAKAAEGRKEVTIAWYRQQLRRYAQGITGEWTDPAVIRSFLASLQTDVDLYPNHPTRPQERRKLSPATVRAYHRTLRIFFRWCVDDELITVNPMRRIKSPPRPRPTPRMLSDADAIALLRAAQHSARDYALLLFLADTGARSNEARTLKISDLDLKRQRAQVLGKGDKTRWVYFGSLTVQALTTWLQVRPVSAAAEVFVGQKGPLQRSGIYQILRRLARSAGIAGRFNPHAFRHWFATRYLENGGDLESLRVLLGHENISTTTIYTHLRPDALSRLHDDYSPITRLSDTEITRSK